MASFDAHEQDFKILSSPFDIDVDLAPEKYQIELIELRCRSHLRETFRDNPLIDFYKLYFPKTLFPELYYHALMMACIFDSTYIRERFFSKMKLTKTKAKARINLTDKHLINQLRVATSTIGLFRSRLLPFCLLNVM